MAKSQPVQKTSRVSIFSPLVPIGTVQQEMDWEFVVSLQDRLNLLYNSEAVCEMGERHSYLNLSELKYRQNPDLVKTVHEAIACMELSKYQPLLDKNKLTKTDITALIRKLKVTVVEEQQARKEKAEMRMLIDSMQGFKLRRNQTEAPKAREEAKEPPTPETPEDDDSPFELLKDMFMHLIQEQKHKIYKADDWFQLINAIHEFLAKITVEVNEQKGNKAKLEQLEKELREERDRSAAKAKHAEDQVKRLKAEVNEMMSDKANLEEERLQLLYDKEQLEISAREQEA